jgi:hypothetical protein
MYAPSHPSFHHPEMNKAKQSQTEHTIERSDANYQKFQKGPIAFPSDISGGVSSAV